MLTNNKRRDVLTEAELQLILHNEFPRYSDTMLTLISAWQLTGYFPAEHVSKKAIGKLTEILKQRDIALLAFEFYIKREISPKCRPMQDLGSPSKAHTRQFRQCATKLGRAPLIAELPHPVAKELWEKCGSWNNVLKHAGIKRPTYVQRRRAVEEYAISMASPDILARNQRLSILRSDREFTQAEIDYLQALCDFARELHRYPTKSDVPVQITKGINRFCSDWGKLLKYLGLSYISESQRSKALERFKNGSRAWRKALSKKQHSHEKPNGDESCGDE